MTKRDFFRVLIKIFGLYSTVITIFSIVPQNISSLYFGDESTYIVLWVVTVLVIEVLLFLFLLLKTDYIINILKLDKGFDDEHINLGNLTNANIFKLSLIIIGGFLIIDYTPTLLFDIVNAFKSKSTFSSIEGNSVNYFDIVVGIINILIGYLFIANYKSIAQFLDKN
jgi:hypothetical protein